MQMMGVVGMTLPSYVVTKKQHFQRQCNVLCVLANVCILRQETRTTAFLGGAKGIMFADDGCAINKQLAR